MFPLPRNISIRQNHLNPLPSRIVIQPIVNVIMQTRGQPRHKRRPGRDTIRIKMLFFGLFRGQLRPFQEQLGPYTTDLVDFLNGLFGGAESARALLVHLRAGRDAVNRHVDQFSGTHDAEEAVDALEDGHHHLVLVARCRFVLGMGARMDDSVHVEI